ncbi:MAG: glutamate-5-semialdehyde dehydrogenase [Dehalococcoidia bacterium]
MTTTTQAVRPQAEAARSASRVLASAGAKQKNAALEEVAQGLLDQRDAIVSANEADIADAAAAGAGASILDRIRLTPERVESLAASVRDVIQLADPVGETIDQSVRPNGLVVGRVRVPLGVIAAIYENRPNVTVDIAVLCVKSGNACVLRGGKEALRSNVILGDVLRDGLAAAGLPADAVQIIRSADRALVGELLKLDDLIDLMIPRGGRELIARVRAEASMPVVLGGIGVCHTYVDRAADLAMALEVVDNAKMRRVSICNALDTVIVHRDVADVFLPSLAERWQAAGVQFRADAEALAILQRAGADAVAATAADFDTEFLAPVAAVRVVSEAQEALDHIEVHGSGHSEAILTNDYALAERFLREVDSAVVYVNASTQFTDGAQFGLGAEVIDATTKLHARGPMGVAELTTYKWVVRGQGQTRPR